MPTVSVLLNRGDGSFGAKHDYAGADPVWVTIGDLNGDGRPELAVANFELHSVSVFANNGAAASARGPIMQPESARGRSRSAT
jgi:FG-GAP-like repeat